MREAMDECRTDCVHPESGVAVIRCLGERGDVYSHKSMVGVGAWEAVGKVSHSIRAVEAASARNSCSAYVSSSDVGSCSVARAEAEERRLRREQMAALLPTRLHLGHVMRKAGHVV